MILSRLDLSRQKLLPEIYLAAIAWILPLTFMLTLLCFLQKYTMKVVIFYSDTTTKIKTLTVMIINCFLSLYYLLNIRLYYLQEFIHTLLQLDRDCIINLYS